MSDNGRCTSTPAATSQNGTVGVNVLTGDQLLWLRNSLLINIGSAVTPSKNSSINTNRKSTTHFQMSLRCILYIAPKPPFGGSKPQNHAAAVSALEHELHFTEVTLIVHYRYLIDPAEWFVCDRQLTYLFVSESDHAKHFLARYI